MKNRASGSAADPTGEAASVEPTRCPHCAQAIVSGFYTVKNVPVHSCLLMRTRQEALGYPTGDLDLGVCPACGFIANTAFDFADEHYSPLYEETQGFSGRFNAFLSAVARRLIDRYGIRRKRILEIGCGKGVFLCLLCDLGDNQGIGIDPGCVPGRIPARSADRVTIIPDLYSDKYAHLAADVICCRHTLEHIPQTGAFLRWVRKAIGDRKDVLVFFEVPDTLRVLREGAFWDAYYEHCSYFTPGSLARGFRASGFAIEELYLDYDRQYILLTAHPADGPTPPQLAMEEDLAETRRAVEDFRRKVKKTIQAWRELVLTRHGHNQRGVLWGSGSKAVAFLTTLGLNREIETVVDINPYRQGRFMPATGQRIIAPRELAGCRPDYVIAMNPVYRQEIQRDLDRMGLQPELLAV